ncbi:hypothetical protein [Terrisporobacter vanillatitrophus]|uniref:hypothetical protein n=1 Tax=Terrisporobacter vanillatitrophus TaxID=3058402 RepID=UPI003366277B
MKKFLIVSTVIFIIIVSYIDNVRTNKISFDKTYSTKTINKEIYIAKDNKWEKFNIKGVNLNSVKPGVYPSDNNITEKEYFRWISLIYDMGANCIRVQNLMGQNFYKALEQFNKGKENPIYLMQGIYFDETFLKDGYDPQNIDLKKYFKNNIKLTIDSVHGNPYSYDKPDILQLYSTDVSKYILGYTIGIEFANHDLIYTEIMNERKTYNGKYIYTDKNASSFESYLGQMGDYAAGYELKTYKKRSIISFIGSSAYHVASSKENLNKDSNLTKSSEDTDKAKDYIDVENIKAKRSFKPGIVVSYNVYPSYSQIKEYEYNLEEYFKNINNYHSIPVIISEFGVPSSRVGNDFIKNNKNEKTNEEEQGNSLVEIYRAIKNSKCAGSFIFEFQDSWNRSSWNTKESKILDRSIYWSDAQTYSQSFGLMSFDPGKDESESYPDKSIKEWNKDDIVNRNKELSLSMKNDEKYIYFIVESSGKIDLSKKKLYIDLDITPKSGSKVSSQFDLEFERPVDFIININGKENSRVYVHEYYNEFNFYENKEENQQRPDLIKDKVDVDKFSKIFIEVRKKMYIERLNDFVDKADYETGKLVYGNGNPNNKDYNSSADFYMDKKYIEIRIPWALLNFMDPSTTKIKDDFYEEFKTQPLKIKNINVGLTMKGEDSKIRRLESGSYAFKGWTTPKYHERLKQSYYILKKELNKK